MFSKKQDKSGHCYVGIRPITF